MNLKTILILLTGIVVGFLGVNQFYAYQLARASISRDTNVTYTNQLNLIVKTNENLKTELTSLSSQLEELRTTANVHQVLDNDIAHYELLLGKKSVSGPGVTLTVDAKLETFWVIDILNELFISGAEAISIDDVRVTHTTGFVNQGDPKLTIYVNNQKPLKTPYVIQAIGDPDLLYQYLTQNDGIVPRLKAALGIGDNAVTIAKSQAITLPATAN